MSEKTVTQSQQDAWKKLVDEQVARVDQAVTEMARLEQQSLERSREALDEMNRLSKETLGYFGQLTAEWRKLTLEATRNAAAMFAPKA